MPLCSFYSVFDLPPLCIMQLFMAILQCFYVMKKMSICTVPIQPHLNCLHFPTGFFSNFVSGNGNFFSDLLLNMKSSFSEKDSIFFNFSDF